MITLTSYFLAIEFFFSCFLFLNPTPHAPHKGVQQFHEYISFSGSSNIEEVERRWHALRRPSSPPQASHPCSEFQVRLHNLMPLGMLIFLLRYRNILGLLSSHSSDSKKDSKAPIVGHRGEVKIKLFGNETIVHWKHSEPNSVVCSKRREPFTRSWFWTQHSHYQLSNRFSLLSISAPYLVPNYCQFYSLGAGGTQEATFLFSFLGTNVQNPFIAKQ